MYIYTYVNIYIYISVCVCYMYNLPKVGWKRMEHDGIDLNQQAPITSWARPS